MMIGFVFFFLFTLQAQMGTGPFGNNPPLGIGVMAIPGGPFGVGYVGTSSMPNGMRPRAKCRVNSYAYHPDLGFGFFVEKSPNVHDVARTDQCIFFNFKNHGYNVIDMLSPEAVDSCLVSVRCERFGTKGQRVVSLACPPMDLNGQTVVAARDTFKDDMVDIAIRGDYVPFSGQSKKEIRRDRVRKSSYTMQTISKTYLVDNSLRNKKYSIVDLSANPYEIYNKMREEEEGIYITSSCDPNQTGPFSPVELPTYGEGLMGTVPAPPPGSR